MRKLITMILLLIITYTNSNPETNPGHKVYDMPAQAVYNYKVERQKVLEFIKEHEGLRLWPYPDAGGYSVGYGCRVEYIKTRLSFPITGHQADSLLLSQFKKQEQYIDKNFPGINGQKKLASAHLSYCLGIGNILRYGLLRKAKNGYFLDTVNCYLGKYKDHTLYVECREFEKNMFFNM